MLNMQFIDFKGVQVPVEVYIKHKREWKLDMLLPTITWTAKNLQIKSVNEGEILEDNSKKNWEIDPKDDAEDLNVLYKEYKIKFNKEVPVNKKNDWKWIKTKLSE